MHSKYTFKAFDMSGNYYLNYKAGTKHIVEGLLLTIVIFLAD